MSSTITQTGMVGARSLLVGRPSWANMKKHYPGESTKSSTLYAKVSKKWAADVAENPTDWENTCAVRMSYALNRSGVLLTAPSSKGTLLGDDKFNYWYRVSELSKELERRFKKPDESYNPKTITAITPETIASRINDAKKNFLKRIKGRHGIVVFRVTGWSNATGHFTLWDGTSLVYVGGDLEHNNPNSLEYYFWFMRGSDSGKPVLTTNVSFWELK